MFLSIDRLYDVLKRLVYDVLKRLAAWRLGPEVQG